MVTKEAKEQAPKVRPEAPFPARISPMVPRPTSELPKDRENWISEIKWNGIRAIVHIDKKERRVTIRTRGNLDISQNFPEFSTEGFAHLAKHHSLVLDGEIIYQRGKTDESRKIVVERANAKPREAQLAGGLAPCAFVAFDLLFIDGEDLREKPLLERKRRLERILPKNFREKYNISPNYFVVEEHDILKEMAEKNWFEGIILKRKDGRYLSGRRSSQWLKIKFRGHGRDSS